MALYYSIGCDECGVQGDEIKHPGKPHAVREELKKRGWKVALPGGRDLCPDCVPARKQPR